MYPEASETRKLLAQTPEKKNLRGMCKLYKNKLQNINIVRAETVFQLLIPKAMYYIQCFYTFEKVSSALKMYNA